MRSPRRTLVLLLTAGMAGTALVGHAEQSTPASAAKPAAFSIAENIGTANPLSIAITALPGNRSQMGILADWDGREDLVADHAATVRHVPLTGGFYTRSAVSEHTIANGFDENILYVGDSKGNVHVVANTQYGETATAPTAADITTLNLPTLLNAFGTVNSDSQIVITGLCVNPVADLTSYPNVNGGFAPFSGETGEILYVTYWDVNGGLRLSTNNQTVRSGLLAFPIADTPSPAQANPIVSDTGFPVTVGSSFGVFFSVFDNVAGCAVDDDGSVYVHQADLRTFSGANIVKVTDTGANQDRSLAVSGILTISNLNPAGGLYGTSSGPATQVNRFTNFSGTSTLFGNVVSMAAGPDNALFLAVASTDPSDPARGPFGAGAVGATPSMIVSMSDAGPKVAVATNSVIVTDGFADTTSPTGAVTPGVNNFRAFVLGNGPDRRATGLATASPVFGNTIDTLKVEGFQVDAALHSGLVVDEAHNVYVVSGGAPAGLGTNPSPDFSDILIFPDGKPFDRRADYVDLRGDTIPSPSSGPATPASQGDGDSDRFDHIFLAASVDEPTLKPSGLSGLNRGFLRYTNRLAPHPISPGVTLGQTAGSGVQADDATDGPIYFGALADPRGLPQSAVTPAGGDDQTSPFRGDDAGTGGTPALPAGIDGGFEFSFGGNVAGVCTSPWNAFHLNSNGSITFNSGDTDNTATADELLTGEPRIAAAWTDLNPNARVGGFVNTFPLQALGFAGINEFKVRWINVPSFDTAVRGTRNNASISLFDDGTGPDENAAAQEGPTDSRWLAGILEMKERVDGSGAFRLVYGLMDTLNDGSADADRARIIAGYSVGGLAAGSVTPSNLSEIGRTVIGTGVEAAIYEIAPSGRTLDLGAEGQNTAVISDSLTPNDVNREVLAFFGKTCAAPPSVELPSVDLVLGQSNLETGDHVNLTAHVTPANAGLAVGVPMDLYITVTIPSGEVLSLQAGGTLVPGAVPIATSFVPFPFAITLLDFVMPASAPAGGYEWQATLIASGSTINVNPQDKYPFKFTP